MKSYTKAMEDQNERIAKRLYDSIKTTTEKFGPQPIDPETGEAVEKTLGQDQLAMHAIIRDDDEATLKLIAEEGKKLGLSGGIIPKRLWREMSQMEGAYRGQSV